VSLRAIELALKRQSLQLRAAEQRLTLRSDLAALNPAFAVADTARAGWNWLRANPEWLVGGAVVLLVARPRGVLRWLRRGAVAWQMAREVRRTLDALPKAQSRA
jgi:hypothetical protein